MDEFGHGRPSAEAIKSLPGLRLPVLGAAVSALRAAARGLDLRPAELHLPRLNPRRCRLSGRRRAISGPSTDPELAAVDGEDALPDLAIGRLPAATVEQAQMLVDKLIAWEDSRQGLSGAAAWLVADNPAPRPATSTPTSTTSGAASSRVAPWHGGLSYSELGAQTRPAIQDALRTRASRC